MAVCYQTVPRLASGEVTNDRSREVNPHSATALTLLSDLSHSPDPVTDI